MSFSLAPFVFELSLASQVFARILARDGLIYRPQFTSKAVAARLRVGVRAMSAFLRRILILMALGLEHELVVVERPRCLKRKKARTTPRAPKKPFLKIYPMPDRPYYFDFDKKFPTKSTFNTSAATEPQDHTAAVAPVTVPIGRLLAQLDHLHALAKDPLARARRLAFSLARNRHGILMAPPEHPRLVRRWGTEVSAIHDAMGHNIIVKSRTRPPPLPPPRRGPIPTITVFY